jgi:7-cyano-7-deazaguanine synthase
MDSATLLYALLDAGLNVRGLSFDYGQRHSRELEYAEDLCHDRSVPWTRIDLRTITGLLRGSALTDAKVAVPEGHYAAESMKVTVVPNRNAMMLSVAYAVAVGQGAEYVAFGAHAGDHAIYPDCRQDFVEALDTALTIGNEWAQPIPTIRAPFVNMSKAEIAALGSTLSVPFDRTWSCYGGGTMHCGLCGTCSERRQAFFEAGVHDPTDYAVSADETERVGGVILH